MEISFFDVTNRLDITERQIPQENDLADWSHDKSIVLSRFYNECFQMDHLREIHKRGPSATCHNLHSAPFYFYFISNDRNISWHKTSDLETQKVHSVFSKLHCYYTHISIVLTAITAVLCRQQTSSNNKKYTKTLWYFSQDNVVSNRTNMKILLFLLIFVSVVNGGKVLFYIPFASKSMKITFIPILEELSK